jgi:hypothetical protein
MHVFMLCTGFRGEDTGFDPVQSPEDILETGLSSTRRRFWSIIIFGIVKAADGKPINLYYQYSVSAAVEIRLNN